MLDSDWESFEAAAARVRVLEYTYDPNRWRREGALVYELDCGIFRSFACAAGGRMRLLPQLQKLSWTTVDDEIYPYISLFLSSTITSLDIHAAGKEPASQRMRFSLLASLVSQCPSLRSLTLKGGGGFYDCLISWGSLFSRFSANACASLGKWGALSSLCLDHIDLCTVTEVLATLPALTKLELMTCKAISDLPSAPSSVQGFPVLQHLTISSDMDSCLYVLKRMSPGTPLVYLELAVKGIPRENRWYELFNNLKAVISRESLSIVYFSVFNAFLPERTQDVLMDLQTISPLLHFPHISEFKQGGLCYLDLDDNGVALVARAWPRLKSFILRAGGVGLTHHAFLPFAKYCPELEVLAMTVDASNVSDHEERPERGSLCAKLRELVVFHSKIDDSARVAAFISGIFPNVVEISFSLFKNSTWQEPHNPTWKDVEKLIPIFAAVRRQEASHTS